MQYLFYFQQLHSKIFAFLKLTKYLPVDDNSGRREWSIENSFVTDKEEKRRLLKSRDTRLLADFSCDQKWLLEPGDMLYLPPRIPHRGYYSLVSLPKWHIHIVNKEKIDISILVSLAVERNDIHYFLLIVM